MQDDLGHSRTSSGDWLNHPHRSERDQLSDLSPRRRSNEGPLHRSERDQLSDLPPPIMGRRRSSEMDEGRYYVDSDGRERVRLMRSGSAAPVYGRNYS
jgi:hypothetical protein